MPGAWFVSAIVSASTSAAEGVNSIIDPRTSGNWSVEIMMPPNRISVRKTPLATASTASARSAPAKNNPQAANVKAPRSAIRIDSGQAPPGRQPSNAPRSKTTSIESKATIAVAIALPANKFVRVSEVVAKKRRAPERRSNPVAMANEVKQVAKRLIDKTFGIAPSMPPGTNVVRPSASTSTIGMMNTRRSCSPLRSSRRNSQPVCARVRAPEVITCYPPWLR